MAKLMYGDNFLRRSTCRGRDHRRRHAVIRRPETTTPAPLADARRACSTQRDNRGDHRPGRHRGLSSAHPYADLVQPRNDSRTANATRIEYAIAYAEDYVNNRFRGRLLPVRRAACPRLRIPLDPGQRTGARSSPGTSCTTPAGRCGRATRRTSPCGRSTASSPQMDAVIAGAGRSTACERAGGRPPGDRSMSSIRITTKIATPTINRLQAALANPSGSEAPPGDAEPVECADADLHHARFNISSHWRGLFHSAGLHPAKAP